MNLYEPLQHLSFQTLTRSGKESNYLKSTVNILADAGETYTQDPDAGNPFTIVYRAIRDEKNLEKSIFTNAVLIDLNGKTGPYTVKVVVYKMNGAEGGQVTSTISGDANIED